MITQADGTPVTRENTDQAWLALMDGRASVKGVAEYDEAVWLIVSDPESLRMAPSVLVKLVVGLAAVGLSEVLLRESEAKR